MVKAGQIKGAGGDDARRARRCCPTCRRVVELGLPQLVAENYFGVSGPAGPAEGSDRQARRRRWPRSSRGPAIVKRFEELGITTVKMSAAEFGGFVAKQVNDWAPAIKAADIKP